MEGTTLDDKLKKLTSSIPTDILDDPQTPKWAKFILTSFKGICDEFRQLNQTWSNRIDLLEVRNAVNEAKIKALEEKLENKTFELELLIDDNAQYSRRNCLLIHGVTETEEEDYDKILLETLNNDQTLNLNLNIEEV